MTAGWALDVQAPIPLSIPIDSPKTIPTPVRKEMVSILNEVIRRTRQHHAIEHATIHLLAARFPNRRFSGISDPAGFTIYGNVDSEELRRAVGNALLRLQTGEYQLALHPNCGTNLATTGILVSLVAVALSSSRRNPLERFVALVPPMLLALVLSRPLGNRLQQYTTLAHVSDRWVADIQMFQMGSIQAHRVLFD